MKRVTHIMAMVMALAIAFTITPAFNGELNAYAASAPSKVKSLKGQAASERSISLSWKKPSGTVKGYVVYRNGTAITKVSKKTLTDTGLNAGTKYTYYVKAYNTYKSKRYWNSKTKKWVKNKPKSSQWKGKKTKKVTVYKYGKASSSVVVYTREKVISPPAEITVPTNTDDNEQGSSESSGGSGSPGAGTSAGSDTSSPETVSDVPGTEMSITSFLGETERFIKQTNGTWKNIDSANNEYILSEADKTARINNPRYNASINGEFTYKGTAMLQKSGITFLKDSLNTINKSGSTLTYKVSAYNADSSKLEIVLDNPVETINTYDYDKNPITKRYVMKGDLRLALYNVLSDTVSKGILTKGLGFDIGTGFTQDTIVVKAYYNGEKIGEASYLMNPNADENGFSPEIHNSLEIAKAAGVSSSKTYHENMKAIERYIDETYEYEDMMCDQGAAVLEAYSVCMNNPPVYGFASYGSELPGRAGSNYGSHIAFHLESNPEVFYQANGHH